MHSGCPCSPITMTTGTPLPAFEHDPLPEHTSHFRLLHIIRGDFGQHVECEISTWPIDNAPTYYAISYTWGDPADTTEITVNGRPLVVRRNCEYVLQQAFTSGTSVYFWVDAICIAQTTKEKNHQVGIMGKIYSGAKHVLACVGPHENDSEFLPKITKDYRSLLRNIHGLYDRESGWDDMIDERKMLFVRCTLSMKTKMRQRLYRSFISFLKRPYFRRLWVTQELHLARSVSYCFGTAIEAAEDFLCLYQLLDIWNNFAVYGLFQHVVNFARYILVPARTKASKGMRLAFSDIDSPSFLLLMACTTQKQNVRDILIGCDLECSDPRDHLFGILSIAEWLPGYEPKPDYTKDRFEVALEALELIDGSGILNACELYARRLCDRFQITGEEASLRRALNLRSSTPGGSTVSNHDNPNRLQGQSTWYGLEISGAVEYFTSSGPISGDILRWQVSVQKGEGCCVLKYAEGSHTILVSAPLDTKPGDLWTTSLILAEGAIAPMGLVVRPSESGTYNLVGFTYSIELDNQIRGSMRSYDRFIASWYPEDLLLFRWTLNMIQWHELTQDEIIELVNRRICAWDGSSYFRKLKKALEPDVSPILYSSDSSVPL